MKESANSRKGGKGGGDDKQLKSLKVQRNKNDVNILVTKPHEWPYKSETGINSYYSFTDNFSNSHQKLKHWSALKTSKGTHF